MEREDAATEAAAAKGEVQKPELPTPETAKEEDEMFNLFFVSKMRCATEAADARSGV